MTRTRRRDPRPTAMRRPAAAKPGIPATGTARAPTGTTGATDRKQQAAAAESGTPASGRAGADRQQRAVVAEPGTPAGRMTSTRPVPWAGSSAVPVGGQR
ncbi:hypothetical protein, partial [Spongiactinospora gelatinilytica]|uniref:hypothetical protein n=1 Tax=Spongiactinospora gelatinilytica TaxID=2666298 RepID=UPI001F3EEBAA